MDQLPTDAWGAELIYVIPGVRRPTPFDLASPDLDGTAGTEDDIVLR